MDPDLARNYAMRAKTICAPVFCIEPIVLQFTLPPIHMEPARRVPLKETWAKNKDPPETSGPMLIGGRVTPVTRLKSLLLSHL